MSRNWMTKSLKTLLRIETGRAAPDPDAVRKLQFDCLDLALFLLPLAVFPFLISAFLPERFLELKLGRSVLLGVCAGAVFFLPVARRALFGRPNVRMRRPEASPMLTMVATLLVALGSLGTLIFGLILVGSFGQADDGLSASQLRHVSPWLIGSFASVVLGVLLERGLCRK